MTDSTWWCTWGNHKVEAVEGSLHGMDACSDCWDDHDSTCGCERCKRIGWCPVHGYDLAACEAEVAGRVVYLIRYHYLANPSATEDVDILAADSTLAGGWALIEAPSFEVAARFARQTWGEAPVVPPPAGRAFACPLCAQWHDVTLCPSL